MGRAWCIICTLFFTAGSSEARLCLSEQFTGVSAFAAMNERFPCDRLLHILEVSPRPATAILWGTFGEDYHCPHAFTEYFKARPHFLQVHLYNGPAYRNGRPREGEPFNVSDAFSLNFLIESGTQDQIIRDRVRNIREYVFAISNENTFSAISTGLEDDLSSVAHQRVLRIVRQEWPGLVVSNKLGRNKRLDEGADLRETHGKAPLKAPYIANEDGDFSPHSDDFFRRHKNAAVVLLWRGRHQGLKDHQNFVDPKTRNFVISNSDIVKLRKTLLKASR